MYNAKYIVNSELCDAWRGSKQKNTRHKHMAIRKQNTKRADQSVTIR